MQKNILYLLLASCFILSQKMNTQTEQKPKTIFYSVGSGAAHIPDYEGSNDYRILPMVNFSANWISGKYIRINGLNTEYNILKNRTWNFGPTLTTKISRTSSVNNSTIAQLPNINFAVGSGIFGKYNYKSFEVRLSYNYDISNVNKGGLANFTVGYNYRKKKIISRIAINSSYGTSNYLNTYFGVSPEGNTLSNLPTYKLSSGFKDIGLSSNFIYVLNKKWMLGTALVYNMLIGDVGKSPVVKEGSKHQLINALFALYRF